MTTAQNIKLGKRIAIFSFIIATVLMGLIYLTNSFVLAAVSYFIILGGGILINFFCLVALLIRAYQEAAQRLKIAKTIGLMLCNIPVVIVYLYFVTVLFNTMRLTFVNETGKPLTEIKIIGCEPKNIDNLEPKESKKVWVDITCDCSIQIKYIIDKQIKTETIYDYTTCSNGKRANYRIGIDKKLIEETY